MTKHTPGPWKVHKTKRGFAILHPLVNMDGEYKGQLGGYHVVVQERQLSPEGIETKLEEGNAHLIAAAPDLLEACKFAVDYLEKNPTRHTITDKLKQVLSKAEPSINKGA